MYSDKFKTCYLVINNNSSTLIRLLQKLTLYIHLNVLLEIVSLKTTKYTSV